MKSLPMSEAFETPLDGETEASGLAVALKTDSLLGIVPSQDLFLKGKVVTTFSEGVVVGFLAKTGRTTLCKFMYLSPSSLKESEK